MRKIGCKKDLSQPLKRLALTLFMIGVFGTNNHYFAVSFDYLALIAHGFDGSTYFHCCYPPWNSIPKSCLWFTMI